MCTGNDNSATIKHCIIEGNTIHGVRANYAYGVKAYNNIVRNNGYGICSSHGEIEAKNNIIYDNDSGIRIEVASYSAFLRNNTIVNNNDYGIYVSTDSDDPDISNCIIWNSTVALENCTATYSCYSNASGTGNISSDPLFIDSSNNDFRLSLQSPCFNAGDPYQSYTGEFDYEGNSRVELGVVDMGADEAKWIAYNENMLTSNNYTTIQAAINAAGSGDVIIVNKGTHTEALSIPTGKNLTIKSIDPENWDTVAETIIDASSNSYGIITSSNSSTIYGLTVKNAQTGIMHAGISGTVKHCIIENNTNYGLRVNYAYSTKFHNNIIRNNGYGIYSSHGEIEAKNNIIYSNDSGIRIAVSSSSAFLRNNTIVNNNDYGIYVSTDSSAPVISNCIIWNSNVALQNCTATYSCYPNASGTGNISSDPLFIDSSNNNFCLSLQSPCFNAGDSSQSYTGELDYEGNPRVELGNVEMGADEAKWIAYNETTTNSNNYVTIQAAIDYASNDDVIIVNKGTHVESLSIPANKNITLKSTDPENMETVAATIIDASNRTYGLITLINSSVIYGLTFKNALTGIKDSGGSATIKNCIIEDNTNQGVFVNYVYNGTKVFNNIIRNNGYGIYSFHAKVEAKNNIIYSNGSGIRIGELSYSALLRNNTIVNNNDYGIYVSTDSTAPVISNCIIWNSNVALQNCTATYSCYSNASGSGNISSDPSFVDSNNNDFRLSLQSPCLNAGDSSQSYTGELDYEGNPRVELGIVDIGADEALSSTKSMRFNITMNEEEFYPIIYSSYEIMEYLTPEMSWSVRAESDYDDFEAMVEDLRRLKPQAWWSSYIHSTNCSQASYDSAIYPEFIHSDDISDDSWYVKENGEYVCYPDPSSSNPTRRYLDLRKSAVRDAIIDKAVTWAEDRNLNSISYDNFSWNISVAPNSITVTEWNNALLDLTEETKDYIDDNNLDLKLVVNIGCNAGDIAAAFAAFSQYADGVMSEMAFHRNTRTDACIAAELAGYKAVLMAGKRVFLFVRNNEDKEFALSKIRPLAEEYGNIFLTKYGSMAYTSEIPDEFACLNFYNTNLLSNGNFEDWTSGEPDDWTIDGTSIVEVGFVDKIASYSTTCMLQDSQGLDQNGNVSFGSGACNLYSSASPMAISQNISTEVGRVYRVSLWIGQIQGSIAVTIDNYRFMQCFDTVGVKTFTFKAEKANTLFKIERNPLESGTVDVSFDDIAIWIEK